MRYFSRLTLLLLPLYLQANTLPQVIEKVQQNDLLQSMRYITQAQSKALSSIKSAYLPKLSASAMYSYISEDQRGLIDPESSASVEASFVLFDGFRRYNSIKAQSAQVMVSKEQELHQREALTLQSIELYYSLLSLKANINAKEQKRKQLEEEVLRLEKFYAAGSISEDELEQIKAAFSMTEYELALLHQNYEQITFSLSALIGIGLDDLIMAHFAVPDFQQKGSTHELKAATQAIQALSYQAKAKTADYWPTFILKDTYSTTKYYDAGGGLPISIDLPEATNKLQVVAQMTLFDFFSKSNERSSLFLQKKAKESEFNYKTRDLQMKQKFAKTKIETSLKKIKAAQQSLKSSEKSYTFIKERFKVHLVDSVTYLDALSNFYQSKALLAASENDLEVSYANYYFQYGIPLKEKIQ